MIAATNRNLTERIESRDFREDLYYRLNVLRLAIPPLRDRGDDIAILLRHYIAECARMHRVEEPPLSPAAQDVLMRYRWPGNVREDAVAEHALDQPLGLRVGIAALDADQREDAAADRAGDLAVDLDAGLGNALDQCNHASAIPGFKRECRAPAGS